MRLTPLVALCALLLMSSTAAQAAPEAREIDDRLLSDLSGANDYGGPEGALGDGALDLLALDVREGTVPGTTYAAIVMRVTAQGGETADHRVDIHGEADGEAFILDFQTSDLETFTSDAFDVVHAPLETGDEGVIAMEGYIRHSALGIRPGDDLSEIRVESHKGDEIADVMPGTWYFMGEKVPAPAEEEDDPATLTTSGPTRLFNATPDVELLALGPDGVDVTITLTSALSQMAQTITANTTLPDGIDATLERDSVTVDSGGAETLALRVEGHGEGEVRLFLESDLGYAVLLSLPIQGGGGFGVGGDVGSGDLAPGESYQYTFTAAATFEYHCHPHPWMEGTVTIAEQVDNATAQPPATHVVKLVEPSQDDPQGWAFEPADITINAGDTVVWINEGQMIHDVRGSTGLGGGHGHHDHDHDHGPDDDGEGKDSPAPSLLLALIASLVVLRRLRS